MLQVDINSFSYDAEPVLKSISFKVEKGKHISVLGESGCGKSTLLQIIYGLLHVEDGKIFWENDELLGPNYNLVPGEPFIKYLAQDFDLMPFISVADNIGKYLSRLDMSARLKRIQSLLEVVDMQEYAEIDVKYLSGGQKQRVALARAIAREPKLLLLDEPFSHIDNFRRNALRRNLYNYLKNENITCITATHDSDEALSFSDNIMVMREGKIIQNASPKKLFKNLKDTYVASFFGDVSVLNARLLLPHQIHISKSKTSYKASITQCFYKGDYYLVKGICKGKNVFFKSQKQLEENKEVFLTIQED